MASRVKPREHNRGLFAQVWWFVRRDPVIPIAVLSIVVSTASIGPTVAPYERDVGISGDRHLPILQRSKCIQTDQWNPPYAKADWIDINGDGEITGRDQPFKCDMPRYGLWTEGYHFLGADHVG